MKRENRPGEEQLIRTLAGMLDAMSNDPNLAERASTVKFLHDLTYASHDFDVACWNPLRINCACGQIFHRWPNYAEHHIIANRA